MLFGTDSQKSNYLPKLASGEMIAAFCLTEPKAGSDAASINTKAKRNSDGSWTISGEKIWITNGPIADFFTVFAKTDEGMTAFIVERSFGGVTSGHKEDKMGIRSSSTSSVLFEEVVVPSENVLGDIGDGFKVAMAILNNGRTGLGGGCIGGMKRAISLACSHANERTQFSKKLSEFSLIQDKIARMSMRCYATESLVAFVAQAIDGGQDEYSLEAAVSKVYAAESLWIVANEALQIAGGTGYMAEYPYERIVRDSRINMIFEGTNEILRLFIALSGIKEVGKDLTDLQNSISEFFQKPLIGISRIAEYVLKKPPLAMSPEKQFHQEFSEEEGIVQKYCLALNSACEALAKKYRKSIVEQQQLIVRVADVAIDLFVCAAVLCRASNAKSDEKFHKELAKSIVQDAKRRMNQNLRRIDINEDEMLRSCGAKVLSEGRYPLDAAFE